MSEEKRGKRDELKELQTIRNLLILSLYKNGATFEEIDLATKMGAGNMRAIFHGIGNKGIRTKQSEDTKTNDSDKEIVDDKQNV